MEKISSKNKVFLVSLIIIAAALIRLYNINGSLFDFNPLRQALNAFIAKNYAGNPDAQFLLPQVDNMGSSPGYLMFEVPLVSYAASLMLKLFGAHNWVFRLPSVILFIFSSAYFYKLCMKFTDFLTSTLALIFYSIAPMSIIMSRVIQSESLIMFAIFFSIYYFIRWVEDERSKHLFLCTLGLTVLILLKITNLYIGVLLIGIFIIYKKMRLLPQFIVPAMVILAINCWWWLIYPTEIRTLFPNEYTFADKNVQVFSLKHIINIVRDYSLSSRYWITTIRQCFSIVFSPLLAALFAFGIFVKKGNKAFAILFTWLGAVLLFFFIVPSAAEQDYYKIHIIPVGALFAAFSYQYIFDRVKSPSLKKTGIAVFWSFILLTIFLITYPVIRYKPIFENQERLGAKIEDISKKDDLVVASFGPDPMLLFYCNRKGWAFYLGDNTGGAENIELLEKRRKEGAQYFVSGNLNEFEHDVKFKDYMLKTYRLIDKEDRKYSAPAKFSLDYIVWNALKRLTLPPLKAIKDKLGQSSLGYVIFDLRNKT